MTHKITSNTDKPSDGAERDFTAMADQWFDKTWYLPPGGDQSWRDREARRLFGGDGKEATGEEDQPPAGPVDRMAGDTDGSYEPGFRRAGARNIMLPVSLAVSLAACAVLFVGAVLVPQILTSGFWGAREPATPSATPIHMTNVVAEENVTLRPAYEGGNRDRYKAVRQALPQPVGQTATPAEQEIALPLPHSSITTRPEQPMPAVRVAKAQPQQALRPKERAAKALPPIGAAYFANHAAAAKQIVDSSRPIGQAYFESHAPAAVD